MLPPTPQQVSDPFERKQRYRQDLLPPSARERMPLRASRTTYYLSLTLVRVADKGFSGTHQDDVGLVDPDLLPQLSSDVTEPLLAIEAHRLQAAVAQHLGHLAVLLSILFENLQVGRWLESRLCSKIHQELSNTFFYKPKF